MQSLASKDNLSEMHVKASESRHAMINKLQVSKASLSEMHVKASESRYAMISKLLVNEANLNLDKTVAGALSRSA